LTLKKSAAVVLSLIAVLGLGACGDSQSADRGHEAVALCNGHGGVVAFEDEIVICRDQTAQDGSPETPERGAHAVELCRGHGGVIAFDDEVVICRDQTSG
jgi:hypothetical protein